MMSHSFVDEKLPHRGFAQDRASRMDFKSREHVWRTKSAPPCMIPEPDYGDLDESDGKRSSRVCSTNGARFSEDGLVIPKKPQNPCLESSERQNLHRELLFNQKIGKSVIGQKTELHKAFDKFRDDQKKKELEEEKLQKKSALEKKLEEQANKLKQQEELESKKLEAPDQPEFLRVHARVCAQTVDSKS
ncbi:protein FAM107B-like isoform X4 [Stegodyphus dumicola]|uniref:protein FAM107B-like isoform X4 n=1 Tax=Stegodyphus dumicola TaxID=202533 RepID=UPI0015B07EEA|nr:protein FAM107B-like isoform X4 [Stegodyphus dumicola]